MDTPTAMYSPDVDLSGLADMLTHLRQQIGEATGSDGGATQGRSKSDRKDVRKPRLEKRLSPQEMKSLDIQFIRYTWVNFANVVHFRVLPIGYFHQVLTSTQLGRVSLATPCLGRVFHTLAEGFNATGDTYLTPDMTSGIRFCTYDRRHASIACVLEEKNPVATPKEDVRRRLSPLCARSALQRVVSRANDEAGVGFLVGFELEFVLLKQDDPPVPVGTFPPNSSAALRSGATHTKALELMARSIIAAGIDLQMYHAEGGPGQFEIVTGPLDPMDAVDTLIHTREIIYNTAAAMGLRATFAPRVFPHGIGTGAHAHISVKSVHGKNVKSEKELEKYEKGFLAGVLEHLPSIAALTLPIPASYKRVGDGSLSGGTYVCWGTDHRECPIRLIDSTNPDSRRFEMRFMDGTANPYLAMAGILGAATTGILKDYELKIGDGYHQENASELGRSTSKSCRRRRDQEVYSSRELYIVFLTPGCLQALAQGLDEGDDESVKLKKVIELY